MTDSEAFDVVVAIMRGHHCGKSRIDGLSRAMVTESGLPVAFMRKEVETCLFEGYGGSSGVSREDAERKVALFHTRDGFISANLSLRFPDFDRIVENPCIYTNDDIDEWGIYSVEGKRTEEEMRFSIDLRVPVSERDRIEMRRLMGLERESFAHDLEEYWNEYGDSRHWTWVFEYEKKGIPT